MRRVLLAAALLAALPASAFDSNIQLGGGSLPDPSAISGTGVAGQIAYFTAAQDIGGDVGMTFDSTTDTISLTGSYMPMTDAVPVVGTVVSVYDAASVMSQERYDLSVVSGNDRVTILTYDAASTVYIVQATDPNGTTYGTPITMTDVDSTEGTGGSSCDGIVLSGGTPLFACVNSDNTRMIFARCTGLSCTTINIHSEALDSVAGLQRVFLMEYASGNVGVTYWAANRVYQEICTDPTSATPCSATGAQVDLFGFDIQDYANTAALNGSGTLVAVGMDGAGDYQSAACTLEACGAITVTNMGASANGFPLFVQRTVLASGKVAWLSRGNSGARMVYNVCTDVACTGYTEQTLANCTAPALGGMVTASGGFATVITSCPSSATATALTYTLCANDSCSAPTLTPIASLTGLVTVDHAAYASQNSMGNIFFMYPAAVNNTRSIALLSAGVPAYTGTDYGTETICGANSCVRGEAHVGLLHVQNSMDVDGPADFSSTVTTSTDVHVGDDLVVADALNVGGATALASTLNVTGTSTMRSSLTLNTAGAADLVFNESDITRSGADIRFNSSTQTFYNGTRNMGVFSVSGNDNLLNVSSATNSFQMFSTTSAVMFYGTSTVGAALIGSNNNLANTGVAFAAVDNGGAGGISAVKLFSVYGDGSSLRIPITVAMVACAAGTSGLGGYRVKAGTGSADCLCGDDGAGAYAYTVEHVTGTFAVIDCTTT